MINDVIMMLFILIVFHPLVVKSHTSDVKIGHDFKNDVLITVAKSRTKRIGCIGRAGTVQDHWFLIRFQFFADLIPTRKGRDCNGRCMPLYWNFEIQRQLKLTTMIPERTGNVA